jgi:predicted acetyltransferase
MDYVINNKIYEEETWVITKNNLPIGLISKHSYLNDEKTIYNVGYWIMKSERKKGYGKIALHLLYQKLQPNKYSFQLEIAPSNIASVNTARSLGFYIIGSKRGLSIYSK